METGKGLLRRGIRGPVPLGAPTPAGPPRRGAPVAEGRSRPAWAEVDLDAVRHNATVLRDLVAPATLCAVVKADAYGHGAPAVAGAALAGGAVGLAVALVDEGLELREAGISAPVLLLSEPSGEGIDAAVAGGLTPTLYTAAGVERAGAAARALGRKVSVHLKVDTGMHRVGADPGAVPDLAAAVAADAALVLEGLWTHLAVADGAGAEDREYTAAQLARFDGVADALAGRGIRPAVHHVANSAGAIAWPEARRDLVRCGIALYGPLPSPSVADAFAAAGARALRPALSLRARVSAVRELAAGERPSYARRRPLPGPALVATVPLGYADGVPRALFDAGAEVLVGGRRRPLAGTVTMDQIVVDCGPPDPAAPVAPGDEVVLLGSQGDESVTADEWASLLGTISYEVLCGIGPRVPRVTRGGPGPGQEVTVSPQQAG